MNSLLYRHHRFVFYSFWLLLGMLQASLTELLDDEAYYWVFSRYLAWGYFDHPPMTALLIKTGYGFLQNELGVRLLIVAFSTATIWICEQLTRERDAGLFYTICFSLAVLQIGGILAVPDIPLMFFTALFFLCYRQFARQKSLTNTILLGIVAACLMYSKYHAALIVLFVLLSHPALFRKWQTYLAGIIALGLYVPHLWWQYQHDWISFRYHLFESNVNPYKFSYTTEYLMGQLLIAGPLAGFIFWYALFKYRTATPTERALKYTGIGIFLFFLISSFRGRVEANWTSPAIIPLIVLSHQFLLKNAIWRKWTLRLMIPTVILVLFVRVIIVVDIVPAKAVAERFHQYRKWPLELKKKTDNLPIVFNSSYQKASKYWFYSGQMSYSLNEYRRRRNNYNFWPIEDALLGKPVYVIDADTSYAYTDSLPTAIGRIRYSFDSSFHSFTKVMFRPEHKAYVVVEKKPVTLGGKMEAPRFYLDYLLKHPEIDAALKLGIFDHRKWIKDIPLPVSLRQLMNTQIRAGRVLFNIHPDLPKGKYFIRLAVGADPGWFTHNSDKIRLEIK